MKSLLYYGIFWAAIIMLPVSALAKADLIVATQAPPKSMNPHAFSSDDNLSYMSNFFDGLLQRSPPEGDLSPALATAWERTDVTTWKFNLRKGVKFHNGNDFDADDVKFTFARMKDPKYSQLLNIANSIESIETPDRYTVIFKTRKSVPWFAETMHLNFIVDKESSEKREDSDYSTRPVGTGAYKFVEWIKGSYVRMEANDQYWEGAPKYKSVDICPITEEAKYLAALTDKQVDIVNTVPEILINQFEAMPHVELISQAGRRAIYLDIGNKPDTPFEDLRVRQAIAHAINEEEIIEKVMGGRATLAHQVPDIPTTGYDKTLQRLVYNPQKAKELLAAAGYPDGFEITIAGPNDRYINDEKICEAVAKYLKAVGLKVNLDIKSKSVFFEELTAKKHDFYLIGWFDGSFDFGRSAEKLLHSPDEARGMGVYNGAQYSHRDIDNQIIESSSILNRTERAKALQRINRQSVEDIAWIPLHYQQDIFAVVKGRDILFTPRSDRWLVVKEIK
ncbi:MAG: ABC transporter substrate-binding protein [Desulforhopalus sp.]